MSQSERRRRAAHFVALYEASNLSRSAFCIEHDLALGTFCGWLQRYRTRTSDTTEFVSLDVTSPMDMPPPRSTPNLISISTACGTTITLPSETNLSEVATLVRALESC